jgi:hypothetical protein
MELLEQEVCMDKQVQRDLIQKDLKTTMTSAVASGGIDGAMTKLVDMIEQMNDWATFFARRKRGTVFDLEPDQKLDRWEATVRFNQLLDRDPELHAEMRRHPRLLAALMAHEMQGLPLLGFLRQVTEVHFVEEEPGLHWLLLPACHRGCETLEASVVAQSPDACVVCGRPQGAASSSCKAPDSLATPTERIHAVDEHLVRSLDADPSARDRVMKDPNEAFAQASQALFGGRPEDLFGIHEVRVVADTDTMLYAIRLADHESKRTAAAKKSRAAAPMEAVAR